MSYSAAHKLGDARLDVNKLPNAKNQHYVWCYYLSAWTTDGNFWCHRYKAQSLFRTQPKSVANEHYFYEAHRLTTADEEFLESIIKLGADEELREINRNFIRYSQETFKLRDLLQDRALTAEGRAELEMAFRWAERNLAELYHGGIEHNAHDIIDALRLENDDFYNDEGRCIDFLYFLSNQYFRTAKIQRAMSSFPRHVQGHDPRRTVGIEAFIYATNLGRELFRERKQARIIFLKNETPYPFIAGDQPVINMLDPKSTTDVELYYPLSPTLAIILTKDSKRFPLQRRRVSRFELENYNYAIFQKSADQVYSNDDGYLRSLVAMGKHIV